MLTIVVSSFAPMPTANRSNTRVDNLSFLSNAEPAALESLYQQFLTEPASLDPSWQHFFGGFDLAQRYGAAQNGQNGQLAPATGVALPTGSNSRLDLNVAELIQAYREHGHLLSNTNPIRPRIDRGPYLELEDHGLTKADLNSPTQAAAIIGLPNGATVQQVVDKLKEIYCGPFGFEFEHIRNREVREWCRNYFEQGAGHQAEMPLPRKRRILEKLNEAVAFESFLHKKYVGQKRFSLEGGENTIPALDAIITAAGVAGVKEVMIAMAHRGRLNVLANILGKTYEYIFADFEKDHAYDATNGDGDVKYHLGFSQEVVTPEGNKMFLKLVPNPSHLEAVNPVLQGLTRAKIDTMYDKNPHQIIPIVIHGDAAMVGQGVVYELAQMSGLKGYAVGGTLHFVINNQIGFTTDFTDARTSDYCTAAALAVDSPIVHVNGDDPEAVVWAAEFGVAFRQKWGLDVYVDMVCYRKHGHNESDEPMFTQPMLYEIIKNHPNPREVYKAKLIERGEIEASLAEEMESKFAALLQDRLNLVKQNALPHKAQVPELEWQKMTKAGVESFLQSPQTGTTQATLDLAIQGLTTTPEDVSPIGKAKKLLDERNRLVADGEVNWALAEMLAYGTMTLEGNNVRLSGQDVLRGTFSHRHAIIMDSETKKPYNSLQGMLAKASKERAAENGFAVQVGSFEIYNSLLSEYAVLGFEYGYSLFSPNTLAIWEAQFGDFANGAQVIVDQFISSGESKWQRNSGLVMLLPHGYEGQGPEHSNARPERYLQLCAEHNMIVANCTTPANFFHLLRRQMAWSFRKPLVVMSPKSLLRHPLVKSKLTELTNGKFEEVLVDDFGLKPKAVNRVLMCSGKVYFDLLQGLTDSGRKDIVLVRLEQVYPLPDVKLNALYAKYPNAEFCWVQEEPKNMGAYTFLLRMEENKRLRLISRKASASPATGYAQKHAEEQADIVAEAVGAEPSKTPSDEKVMETAA